ncbi:MAG: Glu-tRNA(Gln) amidotransferase subunit GatD [Desulfurococcaceae archaeon]|nr:Glu-tRNA(Gln) amidotransferase subunit GatD [Desulfurococcaceae archaeon]
MNDPLAGYKGRVRTLLEALGVSIGCKLKIVVENSRVIYGLLMPKHELSHPDIIVLKLDNGYNIGIDANKITSIDVVECRKIGDREEVLKSTEISKGNPIVKILGCGGTIASKVEYETGAVKPAMTPEELMELIPELRGLASYDVEVLFNILSEDMTPRHWEIMARNVLKAINGGVNGVVITHGTDTMSYSAAAIAFALRNLPMPIAFVGAQRSSDRPSTDAALNLLAAVVTTLKAPFGESVVVMHSTPSDIETYIHRGVKVRKLHSSRRDAFQSVNDLPLASVDLLSLKINMINDRFLPRRKPEELIAKIDFDDRVAIIKAYPGIQSEIIDYLVDKKFHGIVIEGTGLGHIGSYTIESLKRAIEEGIAVVMTTQTIFGRVNMNVYTTGRKLLEIGVIPGEDMLTETAYVKLSWVLAQTKDLRNVRDMMLTNYVNEINPRHIAEIFMKFDIKLPKR